MKRLLGLMLAATLVAAATTPAAAATLDRAGKWRPEPQPALPTRLTATTLINDGSFELGPPPASAWTEASNVACERIGDFSGAWYVSAYDGVNDYWAGGYCVDDLTGNNVAVTSSVTQSLAVPAGSPSLSFYYVALRLEPDDAPLDGDRAYVAINGQEIWTLELREANNSYPDWIGPITVNLSAWAGQTVTLSLGGVSVGETTGNLRIDQIELIAGPTPVQPASWGVLKSLPWR